MSRPRLPLIAAVLAAVVTVGACTAPPVITMVPRTSGDAATTSEPPAAPAPPQITRPTTQSAPTESSSGSNQETQAEPTTAGVDLCSDGSACVIGDRGIGDPYYPDSGNGGYQVENYAITITYDPATNALEGDTIISAVVTATDPLARFNLDLQPTMSVGAVEIDGVAAGFEQEDAELIITPAAPLAPEQAVEVRVVYSGEPDAKPGGTASLGDGGWHRTSSGGALAIGEPYSASAWYPVNEHPRDPAAFDVTAIVPDEWNVISIGSQAEPETEAPEGWIASRWVLDTPIASYLTTLWIDTFDIVEHTTADGVPVISAIKEGPGEQRYRLLAARTGPIIDQLTEWFGDYPFDSAGGIYTNESTSFALETATRPVYADWVNEETVIHELAHQWWGDQTMVDTWSDICLNECFASYAPWLYFAETREVDLDHQWWLQMADLVDDQRFWSSPLVGMGSGQEFTSVYSRGPLALHALRHQIGDEDFFAMMKGWLQETAGQNATFDEWVAYTEEVSGQDLTGFVDAWFRGTEVPAEEYRFPGTLGG